MKKIAEHFKSGRKNLRPAILRPKDSELFKIFIYIKNHHQKYGG